MRVHDFIDGSAMKRATKAHMLVPMTKIPPTIISASVSDNMAD